MNENKNNLYKTLVNISQINYLFDIDSRELKKALSGRKSCTIEFLSEVFKDQFRSYDERFDNKNKILFTIDMIHEKGLPRNLFEQAKLNSNNVKKSALTGKFKILESILNSRDLKKLVSAIEFAHHWKYGKFIVKIIFVVLFIGSLFSCKKEEIQPLPKLKPDFHQIDTPRINHPDTLKLSVKWQGE